jgi:O-antigen ligase
MGKLGHTKGLPHAHNVASQAMGEMGIPGLAVVAGTTIWAIRIAVKQLTDKHDISMTHLTVTTLVYLVITGATTSHYIYLMINQTLIGYLLSGLSYKKEPAKKEREFIVNPADQAFGA